MRLKFTCNLKQSRLILIYAGWGMDWRPFVTLQHAGYDIAVIWDYTDLTMRWKPLLRYDEICVMAWSMGVFVASVTMHEILPRVTQRIAVNGTLEPIHPTLGIPPAIWHGTFNGLSPVTVRKFQRRMCMSAAEFAAFSEGIPKRTVASLAREMTALETHTMFHPQQIKRWDMAVIGRHDAIFNPDNQAAAWRDNAPVKYIDRGHWPDFKALVSRLIIDKDKVGQRFGRASSSTYNARAVVQHAIAGRLYDLFEQYHGTSPLLGNIYEIGPGSNSTLARRYMAHTDPLSRIRLWDLGDVDLGDTEAPCRTSLHRCDAEMEIRRTPSESAAYIFSASTIQWFNSPGTFLSECARVLAPGGWLVLSSFVMGNFHEINSVAGIGLQLPPLKGWRTLVPDSLEVLTIQEQTVPLTFDTPRQVLDHMRATGVNNVNFGAAPHVTARTIMERYPRDLQGKCTLTYRPFYLIARKPDN